MEGAEGEEGEEGENVDGEVAASETPTLIKNSFIILIFWQNFVKIGRNFNFVLQNKLKTQHFATRSPSKKKAGAATQIVQRPIYHILEEAAQVEETLNS